MNIKTTTCRIAIRFAFGLHAIALLAFSPQSTFGYQLLSPPAKPVDAVNSVPIHTILTKQWERNPTNAAESKKTFENSSKNPTLLVAYAVNRLQQNKTRESKLIAEELTTNYQSNLDGWMLKTWFNTLEDNFDVALINMRAFKKQIDNTRNLSDATTLQIYKRLGRLIGYMQGPVASRVNRDILDDTIVAIADGLPPDVLKAFNDNRDKVLQAYDDLIKNQANKTQNELVKVQAENEQERIALERQNDLLEQTESQLLPERDRIRGDGQQQISSLERQGNSIQQQLNAVASDIDATIIDLQYMYADLAALTYPHHGQYVSTYGLRNQIRNAEFSLAALRNNGVGYSNQLNTIGNQISQTQYNVRQQLNQIDKEIRRVNGAKRRNLGKLAKIARGPRVADGKKGAMKNRATSLVTYDDLPEELYRQQILDHLTIN